jgi:hypothetical protein
MLPITKTTSHLFDHLDFAVETLGHRIGDPMFKEGQNVRQMIFQSFSRLDHGTQTGMRGPVIPPGEKTFRPLGIFIIPEGAQRFLKRPGPAGLQVDLAQFGKFLATPIRDVFFVGQPKITGLVQRFIDAPCPPPVLPGGPHETGQKQYPPGAANRE